MKNISLAELLDQRDIPVFNEQASLEDLIIYDREHCCCSHFYFTNREGVLTGILSKQKILEFLSSLFFLVDKNQEDRLAETLATVKVRPLMDTHAPSLRLNQSLPQGVEVLLLSGYSALPVLDDKRKLIGEVSRDSLLGILPLKQREVRYAVS